MHPFFINKKAMIPDFKIKLNKKQKLPVQKALFSIGCEWCSGYQKSLPYAGDYLYVRNGQMKYGTKIRTFKASKERELDIDELLHLIEKEKQMKKLPKKWCVKDCPEVTAYVEKKWNAPIIKAYDYYYCEGGNYPSSNVRKSAFLKEKPDNHVELTIEQFRELVLKEKEDRKIIGYKLVKKEFEQIAVQIALMVVPLPFTACPEYREKGYFPVEEYNYTIAQLKKAGVLEQWFEPVYEQNVQVWKVSVSDADKKYLVTYTANREKQILVVDILYRDIDRAGINERYTFGFSELDYVLDVLKYGPKVGVTGWYVKRSKQSHNLMDSDWLDVGCQKEIITFGMLKEIVEFLKS